MKNTVATLAAMKRNGEKISQLTCYDYSTAKLIDAAGINMILVGDSLGMTMQGYKDTLPVTVDEMIVYGRSVVRGCKETFVVVDMPFMSYQISVEQAMQNAGRIMKETGASENMGRYVCITDGKTEICCYGLESVSVEEGQPIGAQDSIGSAKDGDKLTIETRRNGRPVDAAEYFRMDTQA